MKRQGQTYKCADCSQRIHIKPDHRTAFKAPCPHCDTCALKPMKTVTDVPITAEKTAEDLYWRIRQYNGR